MQSEQKKEFLLTGAYYAVLAAALYLFLRYLLWWLLPFLLAFAAARAMEPVILLLRRTVHFKRGFSAALLTLFLLFLLGGLLSLLLSALFTEATAFLTQLPTLLDALPALTGGLLDRLRAYGALCPDWLRELQAQDAPNSPNGTHYMAKFSEDFMRRANSKDMDQVMAALPFRSMAFSGLNDRKGHFVLIPKDEDRSKELRPPRRSVRRQLKQEPHHAGKSAEKKAPTRKKKEPER